MVVLDIEAGDGQCEAFRRVLAIRTFDAKAAGLFSDGGLPGFAHLYVGEGAIGVGACSALESDDCITSTHRGRGHCIARGPDPGLMMAGLLGKADGYCNGKGGSMHIVDVDTGMLGVNGIVGARPPLATGVTLTSHLKGGDTVALAFFDNGTIAQGQIHGAVDLATTWSLPAVFLVGDNQYGETAPIEGQHNVQSLSETAEAYNIPDFTVGGMNITAAYETVKEARRRAADDEGPTFIETETYRCHGHFGGDQQPYQTEEDVTIWRDRDAIGTFKRRLMNAGTTTEAEFNGMKTEVDQQIEGAVEKAKDAAYPDPSEAYGDMFSAAIPEVSDSSNEMQADGDENR